MGRPPNLPAFTQDGGPAFAVDGPVDTAAPHERGVRSVHDGVDALVGDVTSDEHDPGHAGIVVARG